MPNFMAQVCVVLESIDWKGKTSLTDNMTTISSQFIVHRRIKQGYVLQQPVASETSKRKKLNLNRRGGGMFFIATSAP